MTRKSPVRLSLGAVLALSTTFALVACSGAGTGEDTTSSGGATDSSAAPPSTPTGSITMNLRGEPTSWNVLDVKGANTTGRIYTSPFMPHVVVPEANGALIANEALISSMEVVSEDPFTVQYDIQEAAVWSDGEPITAADFEYTWKVQDPEECPDCLPGTNGGYELMNAVESTNDGKTARVVYDEPYQAWQTMFQGLLPAHIASQNGTMAESFNEYFATTPPTWSGGPYLLSSYEAGKQITFTPNPKWYGADGPYLAELHLRPVTDQTAIVNAFQNSELELLSTFPTQAMVDTIKTVPGAQIDIRPGLINFEIQLQVSGDPLSDVALRRAITVAIDTDAARQRTIGSFAPDIPTTGSVIFMPGQTVEGEEVYQDRATELGIGTGNAEKATQILTDAGYTLTDGQLVDPEGQAVRPLRLLTYSADDTRVKMAELAQGDLEKIGLEISINSVGPDQYTERIQAGDWDMLVTGQGYDTTAESASLLYSSDGVRNYTGYHNAEVDQLLATAAQTVDLPKAAELMGQADQLLLEDAVKVPYFASPNMLAWTGKVHGINPTGGLQGPTVQTETWFITP